MRTARSAERQQIEEAAQVYLEAGNTLCTWAMGITQHRHSVATIREITNFLLLRRNLGRPGAGVCPVRGHSNVQGDRTVGINENPPQAFLDALEREFGFTAPREPGHNVLAAIGAMLDGSARVFIGLGGNFARATPDSALVAKAMASLQMTVHVATKLNHSHLVPGKVSFILPWGFEEYNERLRKPRGFYLPNAAREREWNTPSGKAQFYAGPLPEQTEFQRARDGRGRFVLQTFRSHDQYNTTVYGMDDLVPLNSAGELSDTPTSKSVIVSLRPV